MSAIEDQKRVSDPGAGVADSYESTYVGSGKQTWGLWK